MQGRTYPGATLAVSAIFGLSGFLNVFLVMTTRPESGLFGQLMFLSPVRPPSVLHQDGEMITLEGNYVIAGLP